jgi:hypothetical protein
MAYDGSFSLSKLRLGAGAHIRSGVLAEGFFANNFLTSLSAL